MKNLVIFTEGASDTVFLRQYIEEKYSPITGSVNIDVLGSWSGYKAGGALNPKIAEAFDRNLEIVVILDADNEPEKRRAEVLADFQDYNIPIGLFLFPNNASAGNIEDMLAKIAVEQRLISCFSQYEACIEGYQAPISKARIFAYLDALLPAKNKKGNSKDLYKEENRNYRNTAHWNLHHEYLDPLHDFLKDFIDTNEQ